MADAADFDQVAKAIAKLMDAWGRTIACANPASPSRTSSP
jgi:hypothetical protein